MEITFTVRLPRDEASVPLVRHLCSSALHRLGVSDDCIDDIELAVSEACSNVLKHAVAEDDDYEVRVRIGDDGCEVRVLDRGAAFDERTIVTGLPAPDEESGRGIYLMRALVDELSFVADPKAGMAVRLQKALELRDGALLARIATADGSPRIRHAPTARSS